MEVLKKLQFKTWVFFSEYRVGAGRPFRAIRNANGGSRNSIKQFFSGITFLPNILEGSKYLLRQHFFFYITVVLPHVQRTFLS